MLLPKFIKQTLVKTEAISPMLLPGTIRLPKHLGDKAIRTLIVPFIAFLIFLGIWGGTASRIETSLGTVPGPAQVWEQMINLTDEHHAEREKEIAFIKRQEVRNAETLAENPAAEVSIRPYTGKPTFF